MKTFITLALISLIASSALAASPSTATATTASFNITPSLVFTSTNTTKDAAITSTSSTVYNPLILFGPGATNTTIYAYSPLFVATTGTGATGGAYTGTVVRTIMANQLVAAPADTTESSVGTADASVTITSVTLRGVPQVGSNAAGLGVYAFAATVSGTNAANQVDNLMMWTLSGTSASQSITVASATTTSASGPLLTFAVNSIWYEDGAFFIVYESQSVPGSFSSNVFTATGGASGTTVTALSLHAFGATNGTKLWTAGATSLAGTLAITSTSVAFVPLTMAMGGGQNSSMSPVEQVIYKNPLSTVLTTSVVTVTRSTGAIAAGPTVLGTDVTTSPATTYVPGGIIGSNYTYGVLLANASGSTVAYGAMGFLNGTTSATSATQLAIPLGSAGQIAGKGVGFGTGFGLMYKTPQTTGATYTLQAYFANGTVNGTALAIGTFQGQVSGFVDAVGGLWVGYYTWDQAPASGAATNGALMGYVGRVVSQTNYYNMTNTTKAANVLATFAAILSFVIASLFMF